MGTILSAGNGRRGEAFVFDAGGHLGVYGARPAVLIARSAAGGEATLGRREGVARRWHGACWRETAFWYDF